MSLSREQIIHLAKLSRLALTEAELAKFSQELDSILDFVAQLKKIAAEDVQPMTGGAEAVNELRADEPRNSLSSPAALRGAFLKKDERGSLIVPKIIHGASDLN